MYVCEKSTVWGNSSLILSKQIWSEDSPFTSILTEGGPSTIIVSV